MQERLASSRGRKWTAERKIATRDARRRRRAERLGPAVLLERGDVPFFPKPGRAR